MYIHRKVYYIKWQLNAGMVLQLNESNELENKSNSSSLRLTLAAVFLIESSI